MYACFFCCCLTSYMTSQQRDGIFPFENDNAARATWNPEANQMRYLWSCDWDNHLQRGNLLPGRHLYDIGKIQIFLLAEYDLGVEAKDVTPVMFSLSDQTDIAFKVGATRYYIYNCETKSLSFVGEYKDMREALGYSEGWKVLEQQERKENMEEWIRICDEQLEKRSYADNLLKKRS